MPELRDRMTVASDLRETLEVVAGWQRKGAGWAAIAGYLRAAIRYAVADLAAARDTPEHAEIRASLDALFDVKEDQ